MNDLIDELTAGGADDNDANNVLATSLFGEHPEEEEEQQDGDVYGAGVEEVDVVEVGDGGGGDIAEEELLTPTGAEEVMDHRHPLLQLLQLGSNGEGGNGDSSVDVVADFVGFVTALQAQLACSFELVEGPPLTRFIERLKVKSIHTSIHPSIYPLMLVLYLNSYTLL